MSRPRAEKRLTDAEKARLSRAIQAKVAVDGDYRRIYEELEVSQPLVSLALHRRLIAWTPNVERLFEYLGLDRDAAASPRPVVDGSSAPEEGEVHEARRGEAGRSGRGGGRRILAAPVQALSALSDGTAEQDELLLDLLEAVRRFADSRTAKAM